MKRLIIILLSVVLTVVGGQAQVVSRGAKVLRSVPNVTSTSGKVMQQIQQQSRRAEQAARASAAAGRLKVKPMGVPVVIPDLDTDEKKRKNGDKVSNSPLAKFKPLTKIKTFSEMEEECFAAKYDSIKSLVNSGVYVPVRFSYFQLADYAMRHNDEQFAITCLERVQVERLTPKILERVDRRFKALSPFMPEMTRAVVVSAYAKMVEAKMQDVDCDSTRMRQGDTLLLVTSKFNPSLNPLVTLSCFYNPSTEVERYKTAADSVIATYQQWSPEFKDTFARHFLITLLGARETATALDYFGRAPLKEFPDSNVDFVLDLADCAIAERDATLFSAYLQQAVTLDSVGAEEYWAELYKANWEKFLADPSQLELADWLVEMSPEPVNNALLLSLDLLEQTSNPDEISWEWNDITTYTPEETTCRAAILHIIDKGLTVDDDRSQPDAAEWCRYVKAQMLLPDPAKLAEGKAILDAQTESYNIELRCKAIIGLAYIASQGLEKPKEGLKILKKHIKLLDNPAVSIEIRELWYDYMAALSTRLGKTKDANKYLKLKDITNN